jgi:hypothetical protein
VDGGSPSGGRDAEGLVVGFLPVSYRRRFEEESEDTLPLTLSDTFVGIGRDRQVSILTSSSQTIPAIASSSRKSAASSVHQPVGLKTAHPAVGESPVRMQVDPSRADPHPGRRGRNVDEQSRNYQQSRPSPDLAPPSLPVLA